MVIIHARATPTPFPHLKQCQNYPSTDFFPVIEINIQNVLNYGDRVVEFLGSGDCFDAP